MSSHGYSQQKKMKVEMRSVDMHVAGGHPNWTSHSHGNNHNHTMPCSHSDAYGETGQACATFRHDFLSLAHFSIHTTTTPLIPTQKHMDNMAPSSPAPSIPYNDQSASFRADPHNELRRVALAQPEPNSAPLHKRQNGGTFIIPTSYQGINNPTPPGQVVGITLGVVLGIVFVIMLMWWAMYQNQEGYIADETIEVREGPRRRHSRRYSGSEIRRVSPRRRSYSPRRRTEIVEERIVEERVRGSPPPILREEIIVEPSHPRRRRERDEEEVIVYEESESTEPPRRRSRRNSGFRPVEPERYAGGDHVRRPVSRRYS
jgi:hypothetical protein